MPNFIQGIRENRNRQFPPESLAFCGKTAIWRRVVLLRGTSYLPSVVFGQFCVRRTRFCFIATPIYRHEAPARNLRAKNLRTNERETFCCLCFRSFLCF